MWRDPELTPGRGVGRKASHRRPDPKAKPAKQGVFSKGCHPRAPFRGLSKGCIHTLLPEKLVPSPATPPGCRKSEQGRRRASENSALPRVARNTTQKSRLCQSAWPEGASRAWHTESEASGVVTFLYKAACAHNRLSTGCRGSLWRGGHHG